MKILTVGSLPPPIDGQSLAFNIAVKSLSSKYIVKNVETNIFRGKGVISIFFLPLIYIFRIIYCRIIFKPDAIYFVCSRTVLGSLRDLFLLLLFRASPAFIVNHIHGSNLIEFIENLPLFYKKIFLIIYTRINKNVVLSSLMKNQLDDYEQFKGKTLVINNFYEDIPDKIKIKDNKNLFNPFPLNLVYLSGICSSKGVFDVIKASKYLSIKNVNHTLHIAGKGIDDEFLNAKEAESKVISLTQKSKEIKYLNLVTGVEKYNLLGKCHVFLLPSYYNSEAIPLSIIEAMRMGCVIITSNYKFLPSLVKHNVNGYIVQIKNVDEIVEAILDIYNNPSKFKRISNFNKNYAMKNYSEESFKQNIIKLFSNDNSI